MLIFAIATGVVIIALLAYEVSRWWDCGRVLTRRQKVVRILSGVVAIGILAFMVLGARAMEGDRLVSALACWMLCLGLAFGLIFLALLDLREVGVGYGEQRKKMLRDLTTPKARKKKADDDSGNGHREESAQ